MKKKFTLKFLVLIAFGFIALQSASAFTTEIGQGAATAWPAVGATTVSITSGSGATESLTSGVGNATKSATVLNLANILHFEINGTSVYLEGAVTANSATSNITELTYAASTNSTTAGSTLGIIYSDKFPFDMTSVIGGEALSALPSNATWANISGTVPVGTKSFRIYRRIYYNATTKVAQTGSATGFTALGSNTTVRLAYIAYTVTPTGPQAPKVTSLSIDGAAGVIAADTIRVNLPYATYTVGVSPVATSLITAATDSTGVTTEIKKAGIDITSFIAGDTISYIVTKSALSNTYVVITTASIPAPTISSPTNKNQTVNQGSPLLPITFVMTNTTAGSATGLPAGLAFDYATGTIAGTTSAAFGDYPYTVTVDGILGAIPATVSVSGTITVKDPNALAVAYVINGTTLSTNDTQIHAALSGLYNVTLVDVATITTATDFSAYNLVVLTEKPSSGTAGMRALWGINKPVLNFKAYAAQSNTWAFASATASNGSASTDVAIADVSHPIFAGLTSISAGVLPVLAGVTGNGVQGNTFVGAYNLAVISGSTPVAIQEIPVGVDPSGAATVAGVKAETSVAKYLQIAIADANYSKFTADGIQLVKNAAAYLMGTSAYVSKIAQISSITVGGVSGTVNEAAKTIAVTVPFGTNVTALDIVPVNSFRSTITAPVALTAVDFTNPVAITIQAEDTNVAPVTYTITVTVSTDANAATSSFKAYASNSSIIVEAEEGANVSVVDMAGNVIYSGSKSTISNLQSGVYAVSVNGVAQKVLVK